jgi:K(+)-stimulated pyrophosphate-energized sodium pump
MLILLGTGGSSVLILVVLAVMAAANWITWGVFGAAVSGLAAGVIIGQSTEYYTSDGNKPTQGIAKQAHRVLLPLLLKVWPLVCPLHGYRL